MLHPNESNEIIGRFSAPTLASVYYTAQPSGTVWSMAWPMQPTSGVSLVPILSWAWINAYIFCSCWRLARRPLSRAKHNHSDGIAMDELTIVVRQTIKLCENHTKFGVRETIVRLYHECLAVVLKLSYDSLATIVWFKWLMLIPSTMRLSYDSHMTVVRHFHDSHKTKNRRAKKVHVQFSSHDSATMLKIACDCRMTTTDDPRFDKNSCRGAA